MSPLLWSTTANAHRPGLSYTRLDGNHLALTFAEPELAVFVPLDDLDAASLLLADLTLAKVQVASDGGPCTLGEPAVQRVERDGVEIAAALACPPGASWTLDAGWLADFPLGHRHYVEAFGHPAAVLDRASPSVSFTAEPAAAATGEVAVRFGGLGVEHIVTGYDHLAFLVGLLLVARSWREMAGVVTGFTIAHSVTLSAAALGWITLSPDIVEPAIALTIAYVGIENLWEPPARRRFAITCGLGLVHGFGFAGMLAELGMPDDAVLVALVSFNAGVEIGQLAIVAMVLPLLLWLRRREAWTTWGVRGGSLAIAAAGLWWFFARI